ncbi:cytochrome c oxidase subunit 3 family protein [Singulisphaera acidiphila]|uniref:Heme/copper-type cytochrome/quinol oxidase, subunit 3 n=1 Tax=Singulisphaera acidiphila (strain ATCC BAA-1392 / DSM 18658 / VKM B-2454 / MOB10) TaxID=886293 RepID=L0DEW6_SINAD|nr:cytochrome c oxidase subunit 3 family protein [Singulisphaera acidiphila]AGA27904.1 heme/copper-type cytochrome/quinol oxidase, subunit 3 [Singulisphaera acidiphila DSM 18658]
MSLADAGQRNSRLASHFEDMGQQLESSTLGMWTFLATEVMFFGGLFLGFCVYRFTDASHGFALASRQLDIALGTVNTFVLLTSSLTMALAVRAGQTGDRKGQVLFLTLTMVMATLFLGIKANEYYEEYEKHLFPGAHFSTAALKLPADAPASLAQHSQLFFVFYFFMTGLHAFHMIIGIAVMGVLAIQAQRGKFTADYFTPLELTGLYWHFVDLVWVFLFPLLYLIDLHK